MFRKNTSLLLFLMPGLLLLLIFYVIPFFSGISYSVTDGSKANAFVGLKNYPLGIVVALPGTVVCHPAGLADSL